MSVDQKDKKTTEKVAEKKVYKFRTPIRDITENAKATKANNPKAKDLPFSKDLQEIILGHFNGEILANAKKAKAIEIDILDTKDAELRQLCTKEITKFRDTKSGVTFYVTKPQHTIENSGCIRPNRQYFGFTDEYELKLHDDRATGSKVFFPKYLKRNNK